MDNREHAIMLAYQLRRVAARTAPRTSDKAMLRAAASALDADAQKITDLQAERDRWRFEARANWFELETVLRSEISRLEAVVSQLSTPLPAPEPSRTAPETTGEAQ